MKNEMEKIKQKINEEEEELEDEEYEEKEEDLPLAAQTQLDSFKL